MNVQMSLLDYLMYQVRPHILSDLHTLNELERSRLIRALERLKPEERALKEWNDALDYLVQAPPEQSALQAKQRLLLLLNDCQGPRDASVRK